MCVDIGDRDVLAAIGRAQRRLREAGARPAGPAPIHFTLCFLGDIPDEEGPRVAAALAAVRFAAFSVEVAGVGAFPSMRRPSVVWVGADPGGGRRLAALAASIASVLGPLGHAAGGGRPFRPHATISRAGRGGGGGDSGSRIAAALGELRCERFGVQRVGSLKLKKSVLARGGAVHTELAEVAAAA